MNSTGVVLNKLKKLPITSYFYLPEKLRGGRVERYVRYWQGVFHDYREVAKEVYADCKDRPAKTIVLAAGFGFFAYAVKSNPDEQSFRDRLLLNCNRYMLTSSSTRNPASGEHLVYLNRCYNWGLLRRISLGVVSFMWVDNFDRSCDLYESKCRYLKPRYLTFYERVVDVGFLGKWYALSNKMVDYDVNPEEWKNEPINESVLDYFSDLYAYAKDTFNYAVGYWTA